MSASLSNRQERLVEGVVLETWLKVERKEPAIWVCDDVLGTGYSFLK